MDAEEFVKSYEEEVGEFIKKQTKREFVLVSDCCRADVKLINPHVDKVESVYCTKCKKGCNAIGVLDEL